MPCSRRLQTTSWTMERNVSGRSVTVPANGMWWYEMPNATGGATTTRGARRAARSRENATARSVSTVNVMYGACCSNDPVGTIAHSARAIASFASGQVRVASSLVMPSVRSSRQPPIGRVPSQVVPGVALESLDPVAVRVDPECLIRVDHVRLLMGHLRQLAIRDLALGVVDLARGGFEDRVGLGKRE